MPRHFCQVLSFEDGLKLVQLRAEAPERCQSPAAWGWWLALRPAMQEAATRVPQAMCSARASETAQERWLPSGTQWTPVVPVPYQAQLPEVAGLDRAKAVPANGGRIVDQLCLEAKAADPSPDPQCQAGTKVAIDELCKRATAAKALQAVLLILSMGWGIIWELAEFNGDGEFSDYP
eukprot:Skav202931  [mRNA]  locus=scaffold1565:361883:363621:- [translate_table: standard]